MMSLPVWLPIIFFVVALFYSMVGFGGGSSYLAFLVLAGMPYQTIAPVALTCNLIVTIGGCFYFYKGGHLKLKCLVPFVVSSIPMAYWGGSLNISKNLFCWLLGGSLFFTGARMLFSRLKEVKVRDVSWREAIIWGLPVGALLGFLAGVVGIGGGIFLSPVILILKWGNIKNAAASASFFIMLNSFAGLLGQIQKNGFEFKNLFLLGSVVFIGGQLGSWLGAFRTPKIHLQKILACLILYVSIRLIGMTL